MISFYEILNENEFYSYFKSGTEKVCKFKKKNATLYQIGIVISPILINFILWKKL